MQEIFHSQKSARCHRENMMPVPDDFTIHPSYLCGCKKEDFIAGFKQLYSTVARIYDDIFQNPADYGLPLFEIEKYRSASREANTSAHSIRFIGHLLYNLGQAGELVDGNLVVNLEKYQALCKEKKVSKAPMIMGKFREFGFEFAGFNGKGFDKGLNSFTVAYPANPHVMAALKGYSMTISPDSVKKRSSLYTQFYHLSYKFLTNPTDQFTGYDASDFSARVGPANSAFFDDFHARMLNLGYTYQADVEGVYSNWWKLEYYAGKERTRHFFSYEDGFYLRLKLNNIAAYIDFIESCPDSVRFPFENSSICNHYCRDECAFRLTYSIQGKTRETCLCGIFIFKDLRVEDLDIYFQLLELKSSTQGKKKKR